MADNPKTVSARFSQAFRKWALFGAILFTTWAVFGQAIPRFMMPHRPGTATIRENPSETLTEKDVKITELTNRIDQLDAKIKALEEIVIASPKSDAGTDAKIQELQAKIDALPDNMSEPDNTHIEEELRGLKIQVEDIHTKNTRQFSALGAWNALKDAVTHGDPFTAQLDQLAKLTQDSPKAQEIIKELTPSAVSGIATLSTLQSRFSAMIPTALSAREDTGMWTHAMQSLIRIRKVGGQQAGNDDESIIARTEARLDKGDVEAAVKELAPLSPSAAAIFAPWVTQAQEFLHIRSLVESLQPALLQDKPEPSLYLAPLPDTLSIPSPPPPIPKPKTRRPVPPPEPVPIPAPLPEPLAPAPSE